MNLGYYAIQYNNYYICISVSVSAHAAHLSGLHFVADRAKREGLSAECLEALRVETVSESAFTSVCNSRVYHLHSDILPGPLLSYDIVTEHDIGPRNGLFFFFQL